MPFRELGEELLLVGLICKIKANLDPEAIGKRGLNYKNELQPKLDLFLE